MRKLVSMLLALCMVCALVPVLADGGVTGEWFVNTVLVNGQEVNAGQLGLTVSITLNEDGTMTASMGNGSQQGTWTQEGDKITMTMEGSAAVGTLTEKGLVLNNNGQDWLLTREAPAAVTIAEPKAAGSAEEFQGEWKSKYVDMNGMTIPTDVASAAFPGLKINQDGTLSFIPASEEDNFAKIYNMLSLTGTFENGALTLRSANEAINASGTVQMLADGMIKVTMNTAENSSMTVYFVRTEEAAKPAA